MIFEEFVNNIKAIHNIVKDEDIREIESYIGLIEKKLNKIGKTNKDKMYSLIEKAIKKIPLECIVELSEKENLGYKISHAVDLLDGPDYGYVYDCLNDNGIYVVTDTKGLVKLMEWDDVPKSEPYKHIINVLTHNYELILNNPNIEDKYKEPIRKIEELFKFFGVKDNS